MVKIKPRRMTTMINKKKLNLVHAANEDAGIVGANEALAAANFTVASEGGLIVPFGDFPQVVILTGASLAEAKKRGVKVAANGKAVVIQRVDAEAANAMKEELASLWGNVKRFFAGAPVYEGHPYHPDPEQRKSYPNKRALGWIKEIEVLPDAIKLVPSYNSLGTEAVNDAQLAYHSPEWSMAFVGVENGQGVYRPVKLRSTGLTNEPNIPVPALVSANAKEDTSDEEQDPINNPGESFLAAAREALAKAEREDFAPLATALNDALAGDEAGLLERLQALRDRLPDLAQAVSANAETVAAWEAVLGAAVGSAMAEYSSPNNDTKSDPEPEQETDMLKKLLDLLAAAGLIQATDPEDAVLIKLGNLKQEMDWKREEMMRQAQEATRLKAMLPAANVATLEDAGEDVPLLSEELITVASNTITELRDQVTTANVERQAMHEALVEVTLERLLASNEITGAEVETNRQTLLACANAAALQEAVQGLCKGGVTKPAEGTRLSGELAGGKKVIIAANDASNKSRERTELVNTHLARITKGGEMKGGADYTLAWNAARNERPDLF
jgi:hypothetical protein